MRVISNQERRARASVRHRLAITASDPEEAARSVVGLHSSDPATVYLSARARVSGMKPDDLDAALYDRRSLARVLGMRRTMFVVPLDMVALLHHSSTVALMAAERKRLADLVERGGIAADGASWVDDLGARTLAALEARGQAVASELTADVPELAEKVTFYKRDGSVLATVGMVTRILFLLAAQGKVIRGRPKGSWVSSMYRWAPLESWIGQPLEELSRPQAQARMLELWLSAFGPGTELDMKWWTGWPVTQVRAALAMIGAVEVGLESGAGYVLPDDLEPVDAPPPWVALLPSLDPTTMGWKERDWYLGPHAPRLFDRNGNAGQTVWVEGRVVGGWGQAPTGEVRWQLLEEVGAEAESEIERRAGELEEWLAGRVVSARFPSPLDRELAG